MYLCVSYSINTNISPVPHWEHSASTKYLDWSWCLLEAMMQCTDPCFHWLRLTFSEYVSHLLIDCVGCNMQTWPLRTIGNMSPPPAFPLTLTCHFNPPCHPGKAKNEVLGSLLLLWPAMLVFQSSQAASDYVLEWDTCVVGVGLQRSVREDCFQSSSVLVCVCDLSAGCTLVFPIWASKTLWI